MSKSLALRAATITLLTLILDNVDNPASTSPLSTCPLSSTRRDCGPAMVERAYCYAMTMLRLLELG